MATLSEISEAVALTLNKEGDIAFQKKIEFTVKYYRALYLRREIETNGFSKEYLQSFLVPLVNVTDLDLGEGCSYPEMLGECYIQRTKEKVPKPIRLKQEEDFYFVGLSHGRQAFTYVNKQDLDLLKFRRIKRSLYAYEYVNGYLYIYNTSKLKHLRVSSAFVDPTVINTCATESTCFTSDVEFPMPDDFLMSIIDQIINKEGQIITPDQEVNLEEVYEKAQS